MSTNTVDSNGQVTQVARDGGQGFDLAVATMIKKNKRALVNRQEDFIIPFVQKHAGDTCSSILSGIRPWM